MHHLLSDKLESMEIETPEGFYDQPEGAAQEFIIEYQKHPVFYKGIIFSLDL